MDPVFPAGTVRATLRPCRQPEGGPGWSDPKREAGVGPRGGWPRPTRIVSPAPASSRTRPKMPRKALNQVSPGTTPPCLPNQATSIVLDRGRPASQTRSRASDPDCTHACMYLTVTLRPGHSCLHNLRPKDFCPINLGDQSLRVLPSWKRPGESGTLVGPLS